MIAKSLKFLPDKACKKYSQHLYSRTKRKESMNKNQIFPMIVSTDKGKIAVKKNAVIITANDICQKCGSVLSPTDLLDYICNRCNK